MYPEFLKIDSDYSSDHNLVRDTRRGYRTNKKTEKEAKILVELIKDNTRLCDVYKDEQLKDNSTAQELFVEAVSL